MTVKIETKQQAEDFLAQYDYFLFDCDGVLWLGDHLLPKVTETLNFLKASGKKLIFVTNNSTKSREAYLKKFAKFGLTNVSKNEIFGSAYASAIYIKKILKLSTNKKIFVVGEHGIEQELHELGYSTIGGTDPELTNMPADFNALEAPFIKNVDPAVSLVLAGLDTRINYYKLAAALQYLHDPAVTFLATNIDSTFPNKGKVLPGAGSIIQSIAYASGRTPRSCGKPNQEMMEAIKAEHGFDPARAVMVGDRLNTDMKFGRDGGLGTLLVLTGIEPEARVVDLQGTEEEVKYYASKLGDLYELVVENRE
ncbi:hypothetical protein BABINDRAFT_38433 [Babjeviella inositovora NRRL Y-12698]|uniref:4-nitrophenylphosphatase n=1 Tax=Babjeviella inositovora NRRL Y-12698 TaxID=984486 RepID=A0A1E3QN51_9ASCO|nr:uncharacterized protein BABINDRAFT_38433 [Babjeviella inositovora NRRL Y-12698]ODQ79136.1 hypothetical protein BABINDRAFT_38433 [Babjeviella inositovora NRRL Y-12698]